MNRLTRRLVLPLLFAAAGAGGVVVLGEPVNAEPPVAQVTPKLLPALEQDLDQASLRRQAAHMRWSVTSPTPRLRSCCRRPA